MANFVIKGSAKANLKAVQGARITLLSVSGSDPESEVAGGGTSTDTKGEYRIGPVDLADAPVSYKLRLTHGGFGPSEQAVILRPAPGQSDGGVPVIRVNFTLVKSQDPFEAKKSLLLRGDGVESPPGDSWHYYALQTSPQVGSELLAARPLDSWQKEFEDEPHQLVPVGGVLLWKREPPPVIDTTPVVYDITENNRTQWDWITWETEGNSDPKFQRGARERKLGLYKLDYDKLRKGGTDRWQENNDDDGTIGGGKVKIGILEQLDYSQHKELIDTFLPDFSINAGKLCEPPEFPAVAITASVGLAPSGSTVANTIDTPKRHLVLPFNYDDNSSESRALGKLIAGPVSAFDARRLNVELTRWATASRSTIAAFRPGKLELTPNRRKEWRLRPTDEGKNYLPQVKGPDGGRRLSPFQTDALNADVKYYSVKTGVDFVSTVSQKGNNKDLLEGNSIHAMSRSNIIAGLMKKLGAGRFQYTYQIEILCMLIETKGWDGVQIREIGRAAKDEVWFPALAIPSHGRAFVEAWSPGSNWVDFWELNFAKPLGRAKAEMMCYFGLQHMTSNAQNFLIPFARTVSPGGKAKGLILRDIGDTLLNVHFFDVLRKTDGLFEKAWTHEVADPLNGCILGNEIGGGYFNPQITRTGATIVFAFPPFLKGDLDTTADPQRARILARWGVAHNRGFVQFMQENIGYFEGWSDGSVSIPSDLAWLVRKNTALDQKNKESYPEIAEQVVSLSSASRWQLARRIEAQLLSINPQSQDDVVQVFDLINAHETLLTADVQCYVKSAGGSRALKTLHETGPTAGTPKIVPAPVGPVCPNCGADRAGRRSGWYRCGDCSVQFCDLCVSTLVKPRGSSASMGSYRLCPCGGIAEPA